MGNSHSISMSGRIGRALCRRQRRKKFVPSKFLNDYIAAKMSDLPDDKKWQEYIVKFSRY